MNWLAFSIAAWVCFCLEEGLRNLLRAGSAAPSFVFALIVGVALAAPTGSVAMAALGLGVLTDLLERVETTGDLPGTILGPHALGFLLAGQLMIAMRPLMNRRNPLSFGVLGLLGSLVAHAVVVAMMTAHSIFGDSIVWEAKHQVLVRLGSSLYTGVLAMVLSLAIIPLSGFLGLPAAQGRRFGRRA